jgi:6-phosphogluconolactonase
MCGYAWLTAAFCLVAVGMTLSTTSAQQIGVWIGTETGRGSDSRGIYFAQLDLQTGQIGRTSLAAEVEGPGFVARHPKLPVLYATATDDGRHGVAAYQIVGAQGQPTSLRRLSFVEIGGGRGTHVSLSQSCKYLFSAQYSGGTVASFELADDGSITRRVSLIEHQGGSKVVADRQNEPHPHYISTSPDDQFVFVPDLGLDQVVVYRLDASSGTLVPSGAADMPPGGGPRHMKFTDDGKFAYVLNELELSVSVCRYDAESGQLTVIETVPTLSPEQRQHERFNSAAEIRIHPSGRFVYASSRGHDSITVFERDPQSGRLTQVQCEPIRGSFPRNFSLTPDGEWLVAGGQLSNTLSVFAVDPETGRLRYTQQMVNVPSPICIAFDE